MIPVGFTSPSNLLGASLGEMANLVDSVDSLEAQTSVSSLNMRDNSLY